MERGTQYSQGAALTLMGKWEVGAIPGPERKGGGTWKDMHQEKQAKGWAPEEVSTEEYTSRSRGSARPLMQKVLASVSASGSSVLV